MLIRYKRLLFLGCILLLGSPLFAQHTLRALLLDAESKETLIGVNGIVVGSLLGNTSDVQGHLEIKDIPAGLHTLRFSLVGYRSDSLVLDFSSSELVERTILLHAVGQDLEEITVSTTRTNMHIEDLPQKVEVLGQEEMDEESALVPSGVGSILGDIAVITIQRTNPVNGNDAVRMQGLDPQYTQLMRDGLPLYGGFSGSIGVLSIPPLDLKQVEIVKGSMSTLYGGGAIAGLINFISRTPVDSPRVSMLFNASSLNEKNINAFVSKKKDKIGMTFFAGANRKAFADINKDGFSEVPENDNFIVHPRVFLYGEKSTTSIGLTSVFDHRRSGDVEALKNGPTAAHPFLQLEHSNRNTLDVQFDHRFNKQHSIAFKSAGSAFERDMQVPNFHFHGTNFTSYTELSDQYTSEKHTITAGLNFVSTTFVKGASDTTWLSSFENYTPGVFIQDDWHLNPTWMLESGLRVDQRIGGEHFVLPRLALFYKPNNRWSWRFAGGLGYKAADIFTLAEPSPLLFNNASSLKAERSAGLNTDINYHALLWDKVGFAINQAFYFTRINDPLVMDFDSLGRQVMKTGNHSVSSYGSDTYVQMNLDELEVYLGYNHTEALQQFDPGMNWTHLFTGDAALVPLPFNPKDKISATLAYAEEGKWRIGIETSAFFNQYIYSGQKVQNYWFWAAMVEKKFGKVSLVLNCENLFDARQAKYEPLVGGNTQSPVFRPLWGPVEGRVVNISFKLDI